MANSDMTLSKTDFPICLNRISLSQQFESYYPILPFQLMLGIQIKLSIDYHFCKRKGKMKIR